ncbi:alpha/beta hydrolase [Novosphingobium aerophilum]|uniref:alpha/beta hydrolase n=2 Tax=Sphingomonadaceae TaxID=41297 RepID=UPI001049BB69|nr:MULTISPECIES: alpha/beta hydrolase [unclassified Novosphingobium]TCM39422.1 hypothetical protein EDF59_106309 [Novosphingobium sp. ST904]WRT92967.1 alpha/beta hydrolase [Novosphingobium sp. RL4]
MRLLAVILALASVIPATPLLAQEAATISYEQVETGADAFVTGGERLVQPGGNDVEIGESQFWQVGPAPIPAGIAAYGPFRVIDGRHVALIDATDSRSPQQFAALLRDYPAISEIEMIECPGTEDDLANLRLGRMIRERGIATHVPTGGSVRSGGVELFLAGVQRYADPGSEFAVHSWIDDSGREAGDYAADAPENRRYLDYYRQMGMSMGEAQAFYAMTNAVPFESAHWFGAEEMGRWIRLDHVES